MTEEQQQLDTEFDNLETTLSNLKSESSYLTSIFGASADSLGSLTGELVQFKRRLDDNERHQWRWMR